MNEDGYGFKTGPQEMAKLSRTEREELEESRKNIRILQDKVQSQAEKLARCKKEHRNSNLVELWRKV